MRKVLQVCAFGAPNPGNFVASLLELQKQMYAKGYETIYAFPEKAKEQAWCKQLQKTNVVYFLPERNARILPATYLKLRSIYREHEVEIVHSHFELYDIPATIMAPAKTRVFWHLHDAIKENYNKARWTRKVLMRAQYGIFGKKAKLLSVSTEHASFAVELGFRPEQVLYFPNGINTARIKPIERNHGTCSFLMFGWDVHRKGVDLVLAAMRQIQSSDISVRIIGEQVCKKYIEDHPAEGVQYCPPVKNVNQLYQDARAFLHVSRAEGLSYALLEAIYAGLPIICSNIPENEFAREFRNVFFVQNENVTEIAEQMKALACTDTAFSKEAAEYNRSVIEGKYSLGSWCNDLIKIYLDY